MAVQSLFSGDAPRLHHVELAGDITLQEQPLLNFPSITRICYEGGGSNMADLLGQLPSLEQLTFNAGPSGLPPCEKPLDLQIRVQSEWDASVHFPRARSICYALGRPHARNDWDVSKTNLLVAMKRISHKTIRSLDMRLHRLCVRPAAGTDLDVVRMAVKVNGVFIAIDLDWIRQTPLIVSTLRMDSLERLVLHEGIWEDLMDLELLHLRELTIHLRRNLEWWPLKRPRVARQPWALTTLRLARSPAVEERSFRQTGQLLSLKAADVAALVTWNFEPLALAKIVLRGWELAEPGVANLRLLVPQAQILYEDEIACDDWIKPAGWPTRYIDSEGLQKWCEFRQIGTLYTCSTTMTLGSEPSSRMLSRLPVELVSMVLVHAAEQAIQVDHSSVVRLALVSSFVYRIVHPVLYHTMVVTSFNCAKLARMAEDPSCAHVFRAVRRLLAIEFELVGWLTEDSAHTPLLSSVTAIDVHFRSLEYLARSPEFRPRWLAVRYTSLASLADAFPAETVSRLTHVTGYFPGGTPDWMLVPDDIDDVLRTVPSITHIAFDVIDFDLPNVYDPLDIPAFEVGLRACLSNMRIRVVAIRVAGDWKRHWPEVVEMAQRLRDPRLHAWNDTRPMRNRCEDTACLEDDTWAGRDIWTEARPVICGP
ncbi:hypothetical protein AURDEDRAFT_129566 [Auricularia subglabra TFB-10046 SS5]|nr:hypothetical protein AURDEDRAFT_129566 [Auricularia subglabra TFB-10046 SS5]